MDGLKYIDIHTHSPQRDIVSICSLYKIEAAPPMQENISYSVGLHPWYLEDLNWKESKAKLAEALHWPGVMAFGECGLDRIKGAPFTIQLDYFKNQLELFKESPLKVCFIHCVRAWSELIPLICPKDQSLKDKFFILHDFNSSEQEFIKLSSHKNLYFSLGQNFMRPQSRLHQFLEKIPQDKLFFETDDSNREIQELYRSYIASSQINLTLHELTHIIDQNYQKLFPYK